MTKNSVLKKQNKIILVKARGKSKDEIFHDGFEKMRKAAYQNFNNLIVSLHTLDVKIDDNFNSSVQANKLSKDVEIEFDVEVTYIDIERK